ncbi:hypothetical protein D3C78_1128330 [compost metagenome]
MNDSHWKINVSNAALIVTGLHSGIIIPAYTFHQEAPSRRAASINATGRSIKNCRYKKMTRPFAIPGMIRP